MGRTIPSVTKIIDEEVRRVRKLKRSMDKRYWAAIDQVIKMLRGNRNLIYKYNRPEDVMLIPYIILVKHLTDCRIDGGQEE